MKSPWTLSNHQEKMFNKIIMGWSPMIIPWLFWWSPIIKSSKKNNKSAWNHHKIQFYPWKTIEAHEITIKSVKIRIAAGLFFDCRATLHVLCLARRGSGRESMGRWANGWWKDLKTWTRWSHVYVHIYIQIRHVCIYIYIYIYMYVCVYIYIYTYIHAYL